MDDEKEQLYEVAHDSEYGTMQLWQIAVLPHNQIEGRKGR